MTAYIACQAPENATGHSHKNVLFKSAVHWAVYYKDSWTIPLKSITRALINSHHHPLLATSKSLFQLIHFPAPT